jgi:hypothetical protein
LYDALDFSTDRDDGGRQTRESLSRIASTSAAVEQLDSGAFRASGSAVAASPSAADAVEHKTQQTSNAQRPTPNIEFRTSGLAKGRIAKAVVCGTEKRRENLRSRMSKPKRIQRSRAKGWKMPANAIYVGRPTVWGNPYVVGSQLMNGETLNAEKAVALYEQHLADNFSERDIRHCLHDKDLACWCALDQPCHADVLLRIANSRPK